jgi:nucleotide-binding universal stress UspA family protein
VVYLWSPPFANANLRHQLWRAGSLDELTKLIEREGAAEAERLAADGVAFSHAAGWQAEALVRRVFGGEVLELARLAEELRPAASSSARGDLAAEGDVGERLRSSRPPQPSSVLVVPHPLPVEERRAAAGGPVLVGYDASAGSRAALASAASLFPDRDLIVARAGQDGAGDLHPGELPHAGAGRTTTLGLEGGRDPSARTVADALAGCAAAKGAGVIVVGSRGESAFREILLGSVAMAVLHHANRPVLTVPSKRTGG